MGSQLPRWRREHSAGGVVVRGRGESAEFLAIRPVGRDRWQLPKGLIDGGETSEQAALREIREEGGVEARIVDRLDSIRYFYRLAGTGRAKTVDFYLMEYTSGDPNGHDTEVEEARWFPMSEGDRLAFASERGLVKKARERLT